MPEVIAAASSRVMNFGSLDSLALAESFALFDMSESLLIDKLSYWVTRENIKSNSAKLSETCSARNALMFFGKKLLNSKV